MEVENPLAIVFTARGFFIFSNTLLCILQGKHDSLQFEFEGEKVRKRTLAYYNKTIDVMVFGMEIISKSTQLKNVFWDTCLTPLGIFKLFTLVQPENADEPIV